MFKKAVIFSLLIALTPTTVLAEYVPQEVVDYIKEKAAEKYPDNYSTQLYVVKAEKKAYIELQKAEFEGCDNVLTEIIRKASEKYPAAFTTQLYVVKAECSAYQELNQ